MKWTFCFFTLLLPYLASSQSENSFKNGIGINLTYDGQTGIGSSLRYTKQMGDHGIIKFEFKTNWQYEVAGRIGYEFLQFRLNKFELGLGLDVKYRHENRSRYGLSNFNELALELPVELRFHISPQYTIQTGMSIARRLTSTEAEFNKRSSFVELRLGMNYRF
jgi:opacity protein-like surface antigen